MSHWYSSRIARIPVPPPTFNESSVLEDELRDPYNPSNMELDDDPGSYHSKHHRRNFNVGAADAAHELEQSILGDYNEHDVTFSSKSGSGRVSGKMGLADHGDVDLSQGDKPHKKRKLDNEFSLPVSVSGDRQSQAKGKGKGKAPRGPSPDSQSATPKQPRKKAIPKKQPGLGSELDLKPSSNPPSVFGDVTPPVSISRPPSPVPMISGIIFELGDEIPPLKKAKKVDEHAMAKRLKTLEESQRKVWTNIARRDIAKVKLLPQSPTCKY